MADLQDVDIVREAAHLSEQAYNKPTLRKAEYIVPTLSTDYAFTVHHPKKGIIIAHRGTSMGSDLLADYRILTEGTEAIRNTPHYRRAKAYTEHVAKYYPGETITHVGHSLGGTTAHFLALERNESSIVFNPGASPLSSKAIGNRVTSKNRVIRTATDPLSISFPGGEIRWANKSDPHTIGNFL
jgi:hypothetical protein